MSTRQRVLAVFIMILTIIIVRIIIDFFRFVEFFLIHRNYLLVLLRNRRVRHAGLVRIRRQRQFDAANLTLRIVLVNERFDLLATRKRKLLTAQSGTFHVLEHVVDIDLLEQETPTIQNVFTFTDERVFDPQLLVGECATVLIARGQDAEFP
jgi:hypothetical protein